MPRICVFCGSNRGQHPAYSEAARALGKALATQQHDLVYGGASVGLMGDLAEAAIQGGAKVYGVIPQSLQQKELAHRDLTQLHVVHSMHARKAVMETLSDAFIVMPGGFGTLDETFEILTWRQLGFHRKPLGLLNCHGYFDTLLDLIDHMVREGFVPKQHREMIVVHADANSLLQSLFEEMPELPSKWQ